jgi:hypothetical protein
MTRNGALGWMAADAGEQHDTADEDDDQGEDGGDLPAPATGIAWHGLHLTRFLFGRSPELPADAQPIRRATARSTCLVKLAVFSRVVCHSFSREVTNP